QKRGFAALTFSMAYVIENGGTSMCRMSAHPFIDGHYIVKLSLNSAPEASLYQQLDLKLQYSDENSPPELSRPDRPGLCARPPAPLRFVRV
ncbi:MAG: hypothetical protein RQ826_17440, partial [Xanthomonadales bacterium]|nr:hypothetical protein [Xanthomonadales bacterium]